MKVGTRSGAENAPSDSINARSVPLKSENIASGYEEGEDTSEDEEAAFVKQTYADNGYHLESPAQINKDKHRANDRLQKPLGKDSRSRRASVPTLSLVGLDRPLTSSHSVQSVRSTVGGSLSAREPLSYRS